MKCPYCGEEMKAGRIETMKDLYFAWLPEGERKPIMAIPRNIEKKSGLLLGEAVDGQKQLVCKPICA